MSAKATKAIKDAMGYTDIAPPNCRGCQFSEERDGVIDRSWEWYCTRNPDFEFEVKPDTGRCDQYHVRKNK